MKLDRLAILVVFGLLGACGPGLELAEAPPESGPDVSMDLPAPPGDGDETPSGGSPGNVTSDPEPEAPSEQEPSMNKSLAPVAGIVCEEGQEVIPQTVLHLLGASSQDTPELGPSWQWNVLQPPGSKSVFKPSAYVQDPNFEANVAGTYTFFLDVWNLHGRQTVAPAMMQVQVIPDEEIHVELLWETPGDPNDLDEGPERGSDVDLHLVHPKAGGPDLDGDGAPDGWFDMPFDCFFFNAHPEWGVFDPGVDDNPGLDRDDTDGWGPENINLSLPEPCTYRVGVHYWNDHGYGPSFVTVRVYLDGMLAWESEQRKLVDEDLWEVISIVWTGHPADPWQLSTDDARITHGYQNPYFYQD